MGRKALPWGKIPASDSIRLGGRERPSLAFHVTMSLKGGHSFARVFIFNSAGVLLESLDIRKGAYATSKGSSSSINTIEGVLALGLDLSPSAKILANLTLEVTVLPNDGMVTMFDGM